MASGMSRVTIAAPRSRVDIAIPADVPLAHLLPTLLHYAGAGSDEAGRRDGWALARVGGAELDGERTPEQLGLRDGEVLLLRPAGATAPATVFDDVVDALATGARERRGRWTPTATRLGFLVAAILVLTGTALGLTATGPPYGLAGLAGLGLGAMLLVVAVIYARALGADRAGTAFAALATVYCGLGGLLVALGDLPLAAATVAHTTIAVAAAVVAAAIASVAIPYAAPMFLAAGLCVAATPAALTLAPYLETGVSGAAAVTAVVAYAFLPGLPMMAYRLAGLPRPAVPTERDHLLQETETIDGARILRLGRRADDFLTALVAVLSVICAAAAVLVVRVGGRGIALATVLGLLAILRSRWFSSRNQRLALLGSGGVAAAAVAVAVGARLDHTDRLLLVAGAAFTLVLLSIASGLATGWSAPPTWGRFLDVLEVLLILAMAPLAVWVSGALEAARAVRG